MEDAWSNTFEAAHGDPVARVPPVDFPVLCRGCVDKVREPAGAVPPIPAPVGFTNNCNQFDRPAMGGFFMPERFLRLQDIGCIACRMEGWQPQPSDVHHLVEGRKRLGDNYTIPLCPWHHRGVPENDMSNAEMTFMLGPSLARNKRAFIQRYGTEKELLERVNHSLHEAS